MAIPTDSEVRAFRRKYGSYRLGCSAGCFRGDCDGVRAIPKGWRHVGKVQSLRASLSTYGDEGDPPTPRGYSVFDWETHMGVCPECHAAEQESDRKRKSKRPLAKRRK